MQNGEDEYIEKCVEGVISLERSLNLYNVYFFSSSHFASTNQTISVGKFLSVN